MLGKDMGCDYLRISSISRMIEGGNVFAESQPKGNGFGARPTLIDVTTDTSNAYCRTKPHVIVSVNEWSVGTSIPSSVVGKKGGHQVGRRRGTFLNKL